MSNRQLQLALAKMLPETLRGYDDCVCWLTGGGSSTPHWVARNHPVTTTEWLHVCWLVEQTLTGVPLMDFAFEIDKLGCSPSWQQRAEALCKVKGIEG